MLSPKPPPTLTLTETRRLWRSIVTEFAVDDEPGRLMLLTALESLQRVRSAQKAIVDQGEYLTDDKGMIRPHPALAVEKDAYKQVLASFRSLNLSLTPAKDTRAPLSIRKAS